MCFTIADNKKDTFKLKQIKSRKNANKYAVKLKKFKKLVMKEQVFRHKQPAKLNYQNMIIIYRDNEKSLKWFENLKTLTWITFI